MKDEGEREDFQVFSLGIEEVQSRSGVSPLASLWFWAYWSASQCSDYKKLILCIQCEEL